MAAVDLVLRRSSRIAQHPHHPYAHTHVSSKRQHAIEQDVDTNDQLTPRALRALKRQRLTLDSDGLPLPQIESRKRRKENDNLTTGPLKEVRRRMRHVRLRTRPQNLPKPRHITPSQPILQPKILAPKDDDPKDAPLTAPPRSPSPIPHYRPPSPVPITSQCSASSSAIQSPSQSSSQPQSESPPSPNPTQSNPQPSPSLHQLPMQVDLDSLIPLDPLPEFLPHDASYTDSPSFSSVQVHEFSSGGDLNFSSNPNPFNTPQSSAFSSPGTFGSNHNAFPSNTSSFSNGFGTHSHEFIPAPSHSQPHSDFSPSQDNTFSNTPGFPSSTTGFPTPSSNGSFHLQSNDYTSNGYIQSNGYSQQGSFSQPNHLSHTYEYNTPVPHRDREVNIWKLACQERVEFLLHRYGVDTIKALVASQARARHPSSSNSFSSPHASNTRFRLYTPASYVERASYTYKSAELDGVDFDMDDEDYDDDDDDDDECDFGCDGEDCEYDNEHDGDGLFPMNEEVLESGKLKEGGELKMVVVKSPDRDVSNSEISNSIPMTPIVPPTVPPIPRTTSMPSPSSSIPTLILPPQIPESGSPPSISPGPSSLDVDSSPPASTPQSSSQPICTPPTPTPEPLSPPSRTPSSTPTPTTMPVSVHQPPQTPPAPILPMPTLPRTPPLSSLHVTLLSEPPRAFMGRGTPPDRRRLSEWGQWGCVHTQIRAMGLCGDIQHSMVMRGDSQNVQLQLRHGEAQQQQQHTSTLEHTSIPHGEHTSVQHGEVQQQHQHHEHGEHLTLQHAETHHDEHVHPAPHEHDHSEHLPTHGEWTSFLFAMLEGDPAGSSTGWYELGAGVSASSSVSGPGEPASGPVVGMGSQGMNTLNVSSLSVPQTVGEADSTLRFALG